MSEMPKLTEPQKAALLSSIDSRPFDGLIVFHGAGTGVGLHRATWERMMGKLRDLGLAEPYVHGGYEITEEGRRVRNLLSESHPQPASTD